MQPHRYILISPLNQCNSSSFSSSSSITNFASGCYWLVDVMWFHSNISLVHTAAYWSTKKNFKSFYMFTKMPISQQLVEQNNFFKIKLKISPYTWILLFFTFSLFLSQNGDKITKKHDTFSWFWQILTKKTFLNFVFANFPCTNINLVLLFWKSRLMAFIYMF